MKFKPGPRYIDEYRLSDDGGIIKKIIRHGETEGEDAVPLPGQEVIITYEARLENGQIVDNWKDHAKNPDVPTTENGMKIVVGMGNVIEGWDMGLLTMRNEVHSF